MAASAEVNLLFGLVALQNGLIDQGGLVAAFQAWTLDKGRRLADHVVARGDMDAEDCVAVDALVARHVKRHGGVEKSLTAVTIRRSTFESMTGFGDPEIDATLCRLGSASVSTDLGDSDRTASYSVGPAASDGQRFRILRPHARGGLGAVYVALDSELHREVVLKQILEKHADDTASRQRFVAEAEITGGLEHPGVVPVYGMGTDGSGRPYYAMRFIKGESLKDAIARFRGVAASDGLELRRLLRRFLDVCNAVDYAHSRGVIHRDLKPSNIILGRHGETLVVDWGLAKAVGRADPSAGEQTVAPASNGVSETLPGCMLGTPAYMSPEQARGELDRLGVRSDVYSLGAMLYCILTGKPPFENEDVAAVSRAVEEGQFDARLTSMLRWTRRSRPCASRPWPRSRKTATRLPELSPTILSGGWPKRRCLPGASRFRDGRDGGRGATGRPSPRWWLRSWSRWRERASCSPCRLGPMPSCRMRTSTS